MLKFNLANFKYKYIIPNNGPKSILDTKFEPELSNKPIQCDKPRIMVLKASANVVYGPSIIRPIVSDVIKRCKLNDGELFDVSGQWFRQNNDGRIKELIFVSNISQTEIAKRLGFPNWIFVPPNKMYLRYVDKVPITIYYTSGNNFLFAKYFYAMSTNERKSFNKYLRKETGGKILFMNQYGLYAGESTGNKFDNYKRHYRVKCDIVIFGELINKYIK